MNHHPEYQLMQKFTLGELSSQLASMLSAHIEICPQCSSQYNQIIQSESATNADYNRLMSSREMDLAFDQLMVKISNEEENEDREGNAEPLSINVAGQVIQLPRSMNFLKGQNINWKEFGHKNAIAPIVQTPKGNFYLIYIGPGETVPHHDHSGTEYSYVAAGAFNDGVSSFSTGDFAISQHGYSHSPKATSDDGCLVLSWVEGRLDYFKGILKPLNSILWWYLHRA